MRNRRETWRTLYANEADHSADMVGLAAAIDSRRDDARAALADILRYVTPWQTADTTAADIASICQRGLRDSDVTEAADISAPEELALIKAFRAGKVLRTRGMSLEESLPLLCSYLDADISAGKLAELTGVNIAEFSELQSAVARLAIASAEGTQKGATP